MKKQLLIWPLILTCGLSGFNSHATKQIAISFDDAPRSDTHLSSATRTEKLMTGLKNSGVEHAIFFITTKHLNDSSQWVLKQYEQAGHYIANHSDQHLWLNKTDVRIYQQDVLTAHEQLKDYDHFKPFFRYPFLDEGRDHEKVNAMQTFLTRLGYQNGYVTVDNYDWYLDKLYQDAIKAGKAVNMAQMRRLYVDVLYAAITFYDDTAVKYLGHAPKHVLLLHENDLAAYFIGDLVAKLESEGWEIISPLEAYQDPIAQQIPKTLFTGQGRVSALVRDTGILAKALIHEAEDEAHLEQMFHDYQVVAE